MKRAVFSHDRSKGINGAVAIITRTENTFRDFIHMLSPLRLYELNGSPPFDDNCTVFLRTTLQTKETEQILCWLDTATALRLIGCGISTRITAQI